MALSANTAESRPLFAHSADIALDRDASVTVELRFQPPSATAKPTGWLLLHTIPITASLTKVLSRLLDAQRAVATLEQRETQVPQQSLEGENGPQGRAAAAPVEANGSSSSCIEFARVGYVLSEIHAYCLLLRCSSPGCAAALKATLEEGAAVGLATPVEYVVDSSVVLRVRTPAESDGTAASAERDDDGSNTLHRRPTDLTASHAAATERWLPLAQAVLYGIVGAGTSLTSAFAFGKGVDGARPVTADSAATSRRHRAQQQRALAVCDAGGRAACSLVDPSTPNAFAALPPPAVSSPRGASDSVPSVQHTPLLPPTPVTPPLPGAAAAGLGAGALTPLLGASACTSNGGGGPSDEHCPICQVEPLAVHPCVVTLCYHVYHLNCYAKLTSAECPLCRFSLYNLLSDARCERCGTYEDLWACLLCGHVGCGRGRRNHAHAHFEETGHSCTLQCSTNRIWNDRSRMFLHQEVALLLGEFDDARAGAKCTAPDGSVVHSLEDDNLWLMTQKELDAHDAELQAALTSSREEAVQDYYTGTMRALMEEQSHWYERQEAALLEATAAHRRRQAERCHRADAEASVHRSATVPSQTDASALLSAVVQEELRERRAIAAAYTEGARQTLTQMALSMRGAVARQKERQEALRELVLLQSHRNNGLHSTIARLRQRIVEAQAKGAKDVEAKRARQAALEKEVAEALSRLTEDCES